MRLTRNVSPMLGKFGTPQKCNGGCSSPLLAERARDELDLSRRHDQVGSGSNKFCLAVLAWEDGASRRARGGRVRMIAQWETNQPPFLRRKFENRSH